MPCFRGVDVSVFTESDAHALPEFPHPDGSSVRLLGPAEKSPSPQPSGSSMYSETESLRLRKVNPTISVYIPSIPGAQFWIQYSVTRHPDPASFLYFKMFMNGRNVTNWGVDLGRQVAGTVVRALYEPCEKWHYRDNGVTLKREGIEARSFRFAPGPESKSIADDGGLIEIKAFRSRGKRSRATRLDQFRPQDKYGILSPTGGLLDNPEAAVYNDFLLIDPKESPYATFRFHYRSWTNLTQLNLVTPAEARNHAPFLGGPSASCQANRRQPSPQRRAQCKEGDAEPDFEFGTPPTSCDDEEDEFCQAQFSDESQVPRPLCVNKNGGESPPRAARLNSPPERFSGPASQKGFVPQPSKADRDGIKKASTTCRSSRELGGTPRKSSDSHAPSIAPSLLRHMENGEFDDEFEVNVATRIVLPHDTSLSKIIDNARPLPQPPGEVGSASGYGTRSLPSETSPAAVCRTSMPSPEVVFQRTMAMLSHFGQDGTDGAFAGTLKLTESEWMCPAPGRKASTLFFSPGDGYAYQTNASGSLREESACVIARETDAGGGGNVGDSRQAPHKGGQRTHRDRQKDGDEDDRSTLCEKSPTEEARDDAAETSKSDSMLSQEFSDWF